MALTKKEIKQRYFDKVYRDALMIQCSCGCGETLKSKDKYGRDKNYLNGHNGRKYADRGQHKREWNHRNRPARMNAKTAHSYRVKATLIKEHGGKCWNCGLSYDGKNACCFDFHHLPDYEKKFNLNLASMSRYGIQTLRAESEKCALLCSNCHRVEHAAEY